MSLAPPLLHRNSSAKVSTKCFFILLARIAQPGTGTWSYQCPSEAQRGCRSVRCYRNSFSFFLPVAADCWVVACRNRRKRVWPIAKKTVYKKGNLKTGDAQSHFRLPRPLTSMCNLGQHLQQKSITDLREFLVPSMKSIFHQIRRRFTT